MKIYDVNLAGTAASGTGRTTEAHRATGENGTGAAAGGGAGDHIELSGALTSLGRALSTYNGGRAAKVQALAAQYSSGTYQVDSLATSRGMVASALTQDSR
jgi:anti-sigma28 factor (negative regulator of flagellin synthesis)